jgi:hypothetical protein
VTERRRFCRPKNHDTTILGRDSSGRCLACKREAGRAARWAQIAEDRGIREAERHRRQEEEQAAQDAEFRRRQEEIARRQEHKYQAAIRRGGVDAAMARWDRADRESLERTGRGLCQWEDEVEERYMGRTCYRRTSDADVYCATHNRQLRRATDPPGPPERKGRTR